MLRLNQQSRRNIKKNNGRQQIVFEIFFDNEVIELIIRFSKIYAAGKGFHNFQVSMEEMRAFLALLLLSGYASLPRRRMYWEKRINVNKEVFTRTLSRHRFEEILRFFHLADNNNLHKDNKFAKIRTLLSLLNAKFLSNFPKENFLSVEESMVPYYGRNGLKQHIHEKPIRFGYKVWSLCTRTGYLTQAIPYQVSSTGYSNPEFGMGESVVLNMIAKLPPNIEYRLFFDNFFTSLPLIEHLERINIGATGTIRLNRIGKTSLLDPNSMKKTQRGNYYYMKEKNSNCILVQWNNNSVVTMASNCHGVAPVRSASRWLSVEKKRIAIDQPDIVYQYNQFMGGVDRLDENIAKLGVAIGMKKWWWPMFSWLLNVSVNNAWQTYRILARSQELEPLDLLGFTRRIVLTYVNRYCSIKAVKVVGGLQTQVVPEIRYDGLHHYIISTEKQIRCALCHKKVKRKCVKYCVGLHVDCFMDYHTK